MRQQTLNFGTIAECTDQGKVSKREAYAASKIGRTTQEAKVLLCIAEAGARGVTRDEIAQHLRIKVASVCGRVKQLKDDRKVFDSERRRNGGAVLLAAEYLGRTVPDNIDD